MRTSRGLAYQLLISWQGPFEVVSVNIEGSGEHQLSLKIEDSEK